MQGVLRHSFSKLKFKNQPACLLSLSKKSYNDFIYGGKENYNSIDGVLSSVFPINDMYGYASIEYVGSRIKMPRYSVEECRTKIVSYVAELYITVRLILFDVNNEKKTRTVRMIKEQELNLCDIPLMTDSGSFIINGVEKVIVSQIHKTPGVFFSKKNKGGAKIEYLATIVPSVGSRLELSFSSKSSLNFRIDKRRKLSVYHLLSAIGLSNQEMISNIYSCLDFKLEKADLYSFKMDISNTIGAVLSFNVRDEKGDILFKKGTIVTRIIAKKYGKQQDKFYCLLSDLVGQFLYYDTKCGDKNIRVASEINDNIVKDFINNSVEKFSIVDNNVSSFNDSIINAVNENWEIGREQSLVILMKILRPGSPFVLSDAEKYFSNIFFTDANYSLMDVGRYKMNNVLGLNIPDECRVLTRDDIIETIKKLIDFKNDAISIDDVDSLTNRRIRVAGELVAGHFREGVTKMAKNVSERLNSMVLDTALPSDCISVNQVAKTMKDFFLLSELCQFMEQTNLLSEIAHTRKISALGSGGITRDRATADVRDIHPTHYGRICPIETPDGQNIGLVTSLACFARTNKYGFIETPYRKVVNGVVTEQIEYLDANSERNYKISYASSSVVNMKPDSNEMVAVRYKEDFTLVPRHEIEYVDVAPCQITSMMASFIPFLESNDTARALMGCNMQRQAVPLLFTEAPFVATGFEKKLALESGAVIKAKRDGVVVFVDAKCIIINVDKLGGQSCVDIYNLKTFSKTNQNTFSNQKPIVKLNEKVKEGQIIADCASTKFGEVSVGKNVLLAFLPWNGYNYEDSVVISRRLVSEDKFTSIHIEEFEVSVRDTALGVEEVTRNLDGVSDEKLKYLDETGIIQIGVNVSAGDILVGKTTPSSETFMSSEEKLLQAIFGDSVSRKKNTSLYLPSGMFGTVVNVEILTRRGDLKDQRALQIERELILKRNTRKKTEIDILNETFNTNLDKLLEGCIINIKGKKSKINKSDLDNKKVIDKFTFSVEDNSVSRKLVELRDIYYSAKNKIEAEYVADVEKIMDGDTLPNGVLKIIKVYVAVKSRLQPGDKIAGRHGNKGVISRCVAVEDMPYMEDGTPIDLVFSPVSVPGRMNIGQILETHLGYLSYVIGEKINNMLEKKDAADSIRKILLDVAQNDEYKDTILKMNDEEIVNIGNDYKRGMYFETPVFDGAKVSDMDKIAEKLGVDKSLQVTLYNGLTGEPFDRKVTVGYMYIIKLHHLVDEKIHARSTGPYSLVTQQPLGGKQCGGGQRFGEMECWALQAYGAAYTLQEMLTVKSDDVSGRERMYESIISNDSRFESGIPESFNVLCREFRSLGFDVELGIDA